VLRAMTLMLVYITFPIWEQAGSGTAELQPVLRALSSSSGSAFAAVPLDRRRSRR
jgi:hypothetical protein